MKFKMFIFFNIVLCDDSNEGVAELNITKQLHFLLVL